MLITTYNKIRKTKGGNMKKLYSLIGSILGFAIIVLYALKNGQALIGFSFEGMDDILGYFNLVQQYLIYALAGIAGLELVAGKKLFAFVFFILLAFVVVSTFFPDVINSVM
jgi:hypothetical protein